MDKKTKKVFTGLFLVLAIVTSASAVDYKFYRSTIDSNAVNSNIYFNGLNQSEGYKVVREDGTVVSTFTSTSTGVKNVTFDFRPLTDGLTDIDSRGFGYKLINTANGDNKVKQFYLSPSAHITQLDTFNDGVINHKMYNYSFTDDGSGNTGTAYFREFEGSNSTTGYLELRSTTDSMPPEVSWRVNKWNGFKQHIYYGCRNDACGKPARLYLGDVDGDNNIIDFSSMGKGHYIVTVKPDYLNNKLHVYVNGTENFSKPLGSDNHYNLTYKPWGWDYYGENHESHFYFYNHLATGSSTDYFDVTGWPTFKTDSNTKYKLNTFNESIKYSGTPKLQFKDAKTGWTSNPNDLGLTTFTKFRNTGNGTVKSLAYNTSVIIPPDISNTKLSPENWTYRANVDFKTTATDSDGIVSAITYDVYADGVKVVDNRSLTQSSNPDVYKTSDGFNINENGVTYTLKIKAWDNEGYKAVKTYKQQIPKFTTDFKFKDLGTWKNKALTPNLNMTGFTLEWSGFNSSKVNYTYADIDVYLESLDRDLKTNAYDVYLMKKGRMHFINQTDGTDNVNGSFNYYLNFKDLNNYDVTNKILGDRIKVIRVLELKNSSGHTQKVIKVTDTHESLKEQGGLFQAVFDAIGSGLRAVGDFLGIGDAINNVIGTIKDVIDGLADTLKAPLKTIKSVINDLYTAIANQVNAVLNAIEDVIREGLYILMDALGGLINGISQATGFIVNWFNLQIWKVRNVGLVVNAQYKGSNKTLTYYDFTGNYPNPMSEANVSVQKAILQQYSMNTVYSSVAYLNDNNIHAGDLNKSKMFTLYNAVNTSNNTKDVAVYSYFRDSKLPTGVSTTTMTIHKAIATLGAFINAIMSVIPDSIVNTAQDFFMTAANVSTLLGAYLGGLVGVIVWMSTKGLNLTTVLIQFYVIFTGLKYAELLMDAMDENITLTTAVNQILGDLESKYMRVLNLFDMTYSGLQTTGIILIQILRTVKSSIPFIG